MKTPFTFESILITALLSIAVSTAAYGMNLMIQIGSVIK